MILKRIVSPSLFKWASEFLKHATVPATHLFGKDSSNSAAAVKGTFLLRLLSI